MVRISCCPIRTARKSSKPETPKTHTVGSTRGKYLFRNPNPWEVPSKFWAERMLNWHRNSSVRRLDHNKKLWTPEYRKSFCGWKVTENETMNALSSLNNLIICFFFPESQSTHPNFWTFWRLTILARERCTSGDVSITDVKGTTHWQQGSCHCIINKGYKTWFGLCWVREVLWVFF